MSEELKIDRTKLITVQKYAEKYSISRPTVYKMIEDGELKTTDISEVLFIKLD